MNQKCWGDMSPKISEIHWKNTHDIWSAEVHGIFRQALTFFLWLSCNEHFKELLLKSNPIFSQTSTFCNIEHEKVFHYVLLPIGIPSKSNPIFSQTSTFCNMEHEKVFHYVLLSIGIPFLAVAPSSYIYDYVRHGGG